MPAPCPVPSVVFAPRILISLNQGTGDEALPGYLCSLITPACTHQSYSWAHRSRFACTSWQK
jgi:hypothetical protein